MPVRQCDTKWVCDVSGKVLMPSEIKLYQSFGGTRAFFTQEEIAELKSFGGPGILGTESGGSEADARRNRTVGLQAAV